MNPSIESQKAIGEYPISVATSVALEKLIKGFETQKPRIGEFDCVWINIKTMYRNLIGCLPNELVARLSPEEIAEGIARELHILVQILTSAKPSLQVIFYASRYAHIERKFAMASIRRDNTDLQKSFTKRWEAVIQSMIKKELLLDFSCQLVDGVVKISADFIRQHALLISHIPMDLLIYPKFRSLHLLESHTGQIKDRSLWYTKYYNGKSLPPLPMSQILLPVFGDAEHFHPLKMNAREEILNLARRYHWNEITTQDKILYGINTLRNQLLKDTLKSFI